MTDAFAARLAAAASATEAELEAALSGLAAGGSPARLLAAMRHATLGGGKRLRPFLLIEAARLASRDVPGAARAAAAVECIHGYSLVHDDLPAMDDDDVRRGRPTVHRAFDEATAILAGDALQALAFELLADPGTHADPGVRAAACGALARAAGAAGMVGGQVLDLAAEGRWGAEDARHDEAGILRLQAMKTGALIAASVEIGALIGGAGEAQTAALLAYARALGAAFQLADDLLDVEGDAARLGKAVGKDAARGKGTLVGLLGVEGAHARLAALVLKAEAALAPFGEAAAVLTAAARFVARRDR